MCCPPTSLPTNSSSSVLNREQEFKICNQAVKSFLAQSAFSIKAMGEWIRRRSDLEINKNDRPFCQDSRLINVANVRRCPQI